MIRKPSGNIPIIPLMTRKITNGTVEICPKSAPDN